MKKLLFIASLFFTSVIFSAESGADEAITIASFPLSISGSGTDEAIEQIFKNCTSKFLDIFLLDPLTYHTIFLHRSSPEEILSIRHYLVGYSLRITAVDATNETLDISYSNPLRNAEVHRYFPLPNQSVLTLIEC